MPRPGRAGRGQRTNCSHGMKTPLACLGWGWSGASCKPSGSRGCSLHLRLPRTCSPPMAEMNPVMSTKGTHASTHGAIISTERRGDAELRSMKPSCQAAARYTNNTHQPQCGQPQKWRRRGHRHSAASGGRQTRAASQQAASSLSCRYCTACPVTNMTQGFASALHGLYRNPNMLAPG